MEFQPILHHPGAVKPNRALQCVRTVLLLSMKTKGGQWSLMRHVQCCEKGLGQGSLLGPIPRQRNHRELGSPNTVPGGTWPFWLRKSHS